MFLFIHRLSQIFIFGTEIHGFFKGTAGSALMLSRHFVVTACLRKFTAFFSTEFFCPQIITD